jgi:RNA polymerase sigma factor (TIGR02999 family)
MDIHMLPTIGSGEITRLLGKVRDGNAEAVDQLIPLIFTELRRAARRLMARERGDHTLQPTALVNDVLMQMIGANSIDWQCRAQFFALASTMMRNILIDYARSNRAKKRGGEFKHIPLDDQLAHDSCQPDYLLALDQALDRLQTNDARSSKVVEMRFFAGMTEEEIAEVLDVSVKTVRRDWQFARDWLYREMTHQ